MFLTEPLTNTFKFKGKEIKLDLSFDIILDIQSLFKEEIEDYEKINIAIEMLVVNNKKLHLSNQEKIELFKYIQENFININKKKVKKEEKKILDFEADGEYIYSSFFMDYGIDLLEMQGKLDWRKFIALFQGLSEKTKIKEVMKIRAMKVPTPNKDNQEYIKNLMELKAFYSLDMPNNLQEGLSQLFDTLEKACER